jgi:hypothetical protein
MKFMTNKGERLEDLGNQGPVLLVFLRHFGCTFCRETMADLAKVRHQIEAENIKILLVHMTDTNLAQGMLDIYGLGDLSHISDVNEALYRRFGFNRVSLKSLFGVKNWWRAFVAGLVKGHLVGKPVGDPYQMPGVVLYHKNKTINNFVYEFVSDRPDFVKIAQVA